MNDIDDTPLPEAPRLVLEAMAEVIETGGAVLEGQARAARATSSSATYIDVDVPAECPIGPWPDGPLPLSPTVLDERGEIIGSILVWVACGRISLLEQSWYTDDPPTDWPPVERISLV